LKNIKVKLLHYTPELVIIDGIKNPYLFEEATLKTAVKVVNTLKHDSVSEHIHINFNIDGISRSALQELERHRMTEFNIDEMFSSSTVQSTRYSIDKMLKNDINNTNIDDYFVFPEYDSTRWKSIAIYELFLTDLQCHYLQTINVMKENQIRTQFNNDFLKYFSCEALRVRLTWTINIRSLLNFLKLRTNKSAHFEIRHLANLIKESLKDTYISQFLP